MKQGGALHSIAALGILGVGALILTYAMSNSNAANRDFISYWAAGKQLIHHANPYDGPGILSLERAAFPTNSGRLVTSAFGSLRMRQRLWKKPISVMLRSK
jgi:hypothetical protein